MPRRHALLLAVVTALALPGATAGASSAIKPLPGGFGAHCGTGKEKASCQDVLENSADKEPILDFQPNKTYCSTAQLQKGMRGVGISFRVGLHFKNGRFNQKYTYRDEQREGNPGTVSVAFTLTGRYTSKSTLRVVIRAKVIAALPIAADCAKVKFTEVHVLKHINF